MNNDYLPRHTTLIVYWDSQGSNSSLGGQQRHLTITMRNTIGKISIINISHKLLTGRAKDQILIQADSKDTLL